MAKRKKYPKLPNGYGSIKHLSGNRRNPYAAHPPVTEFTEHGLPINPPALCYVDNWFKAFTVLTWYHNGDYYPGREKELSSDTDDLNKQIHEILAQYNQTRKESLGKKTFEDVFKDYYLDKFKVEYGYKGKKTSMEQGMTAAYKNCASLHDKAFARLTKIELQECLNTCKKKRASSELIKTLYNQMYRFAISSGICEKDYSSFVMIEKARDCESGIPFSSAELKVLWAHKENEIIELLIIMCYSGFRISAYKDMLIDLDEIFFKGGVKTDAGKDRIVPIHSGIYGLVKHRLKRDGALLKIAPGTYRKFMYEALSKLGMDKHTPHDCRHTFSTLCEKYGVNENDRKRMLGHAFQDITNKIYGHRELEDLRTEIEKIKICY